MLKIPTNIAFEVIDLILKRLKTSFILKKISKSKSLSLNLKKQNQYLNFYQLKLLTKFVKTKKRLI